MLCKDLHKQQTQNKHNTDSILRIGPGTRIRGRFPAQEQAPPERVRTMHTRFGGACFGAGKQPQIRGPVSRLEYGALLHVKKIKKIKKKQKSKNKKQKNQHNKNKNNSFNVDH